MALQIIHCCVCARPKYREVDPVHVPGQYARMHLRGWCACVEDARGFIIKVGPPAKRLDRAEYERVNAGYL